MHHTALRSWPSSILITEYQFCFKLTEICFVNYKQKLIFNVRINIIRKQLTIKAETITVIAQCMNDSNGPTRVANCLLDKVKSTIAFLLPKHFWLRLYSQHMMCTYWHNMYLYMKPITIKGKILQ